MSAIARPAAAIVASDTRLPIPVHMLGSTDQVHVGYSDVIRHATGAIPGQLWERLAELAPAGRRPGDVARARRGRGTWAYGGPAFGYHRESNGVITAGSPRFPLQAR